MALTMQQMELEIKRLRAEVEAMRRPKSVAKLVLGPPTIEFQVVDNVTLQYRVSGGEWISILTLRQRANGATLQHSIEPSGSFTWVTWETGELCE